MRKPTKKQQQAFYEDALEYIVLNGAKNTYKGAMCTQYKIDTIAGELNISLEEPGQSSIYSIFCRFENVELAKELITDGKLNPYSGKYNFHEYYPAILLNDFKNKIDNLLIAKHETV